MMSPLMLSPLFFESRDERGEPVELSDERRTDEVEGASDAAPDRERVASRNDSLIMRRHNLFTIYAQILPHLAEAFDERVRQFVRSGSDLQEITEENVRLDDLQLICARRTARCNVKGNRLYTRVIKDIREDRCASLDAWLKRSFYGCVQELSSTIWNSEEFRNRKKEIVSDIALGKEYFYYALAGYNQEIAKTILESFPSLLQPYHEEYNPHGITSAEDARTLLRAALAGRNKEVVAKILASFPSLLYPYQEEYNPDGIKTDLEFIELFTRGLCSYRGILPNTLVEIYDVGPLLPDVSNGSEEDRAQQYENYKRLLSGSFPLLAEKSISTICSRLEASGAPLSEIVTLLVSKASLHKKEVFDPLKALYEKKFQQLSGPGREKQSDVDMEEGENTHDTSGALEAGKRHEELSSAYRIFKKFKEEKRTNKQLRSNVNSSVQELLRSLEEWGDKESLGTGNQTSKRRRESDAHSPTKKFKETTESGSRKSHNTMFEEDKNQTEKDNPNTSSWVSRVKLYT